MTRKEREEIKQIVLEVATKVSELTETPSVSSPDLISISRKEGNHYLSRKITLSNFLKETRERYPSFDGAKYAGVAKPTDAFFTPSKTSSTFWFAFEPGKYPAYGGLEVTDTPKVFTYSLPDFSWLEDSLWDTPNGSIAFKFHYTSLEETTLETDKIAVSGSNTYSFTMDIYPTGTYNTCKIYEYTAGGTLVHISTKQGNAITLTPQETSVYAVIEIAQDISNPIDIEKSSAILTAPMYVLVGDSYKYFAIVGNQLVPESWPWSKITDTPTTMAGYGITDGINANALNTALDNYYTKTQSDNKYQAKDNYLKIEDIKEITVVAGAVVESNFFPCTQQATISVPSKTSHLINDSHFVTEESIPTTFAWESITEKPNSISGYGITDAFIQGLDIHLGSNSVTIPTTLPASDVYAWAKAPAKPTYNFSEIGSTPTTLAGYGITDAATSASVAAIQALIPVQATSSNQLADKNFVNSSIATATATFRGTSESGLTEEQFLAWADTLTADANDYIYWNTEDNAGNTVYKRYKYTLDGWAYEYSLNNSSFTANEWAAIQSGITSELVGKLSDLPNNSTLESSLNSKVDKITGKQLSTEDYTTTEKNKLSGIASNAQVNVLEGVKVNGTNLPIADKKVDITVPTKTSELTNDDNVVKDASYTHTDNNYTTTEKNKLSGIASGAQVNVLEGVKVDGTELSITNKKVNIDLSGKVDVAGSDTNSDEFVYRQTGDGLDIEAKNARIESVKGKSLVWNQMVLSFSSSVLGMQVVTSGNVVSITGSCSRGNYGGLGSLDKSTVIDHKYLLALDVNKWSVSEGSFDIRLRGAPGDLSAVNGATPRRIVVASNEYSSCRCYGTEGAIVDVEFSFMCLDLTLMFGVGNEPSSVEEFEKMFPLPYYEYNEGTLISNDASALESVGFNQWDEETRNGYYNDSGEWTSNAGYTSNKNPINVLPSTNYCIYCVNGNPGRLCIYDNAGTFIRTALLFNKYTFTTPANAAFINFDMKSAYGGTYNHDICINLSNPSKNGTYEPYKKRTLPLNLDSIKVKSHNIWDEEWEIGGINDSGSDTPLNDRIRSKGYTPILGGESYYISAPDSVVVHYYDASKTWISSRNDGSAFAFTTPSNAKYLRFRTVASYGTTYNNDICINLSSSFNGQYEPHGDITITGGLKSAGNVYDEIVGNKYIKRVGSVDLGSLTWTARTEIMAGKFSSSDLTDYAFKNGVTTICSKYTSASNNAVSQITTDKTTYLFYQAGQSSRQVYINDTSYSSSTAAQFKTAMSGVMLYYELATPIEYELDTPINTDYPVDKLGTEGVISDTIPTPPFLADITYHEANIKDIEVEGIADILLKISELEARIKELENPS